MFFLIQFKMKGKKRAKYTVLGVERNEKEMLNEEKV